MVSVQETGAACTAATWKRSGAAPPGSGSALSVASAAVRDRPLRLWPSGHQLSAAAVEAGGVHSCRSIPVQPGPEKGAGTVVILSPAWRTPQGGVGLARGRADRADRADRRAGAALGLSLAVAALAAFLAAICLPAAGCARPADRARRPLRIGIYNDPLTLDPHRRNELLTFSVLRNVYESLPAFVAGTKTGPALADS